MKQLWRFVTHPELLMSKLFKHKYFRNIDLLCTKPKARDSFVWKSVVGVMEIFKSGLELTDDNEWRWKLTEAGIYSVKSGYELAKYWIISRQADVGDCSDLDRNGQIWKKLWRMRISGRIKLVTWRLLHNSLPVLQNLLRRGCLVNIDCVACGLKKRMRITYSLNAGGRSASGPQWAWQIRYG